MTPLDTLERMEREATPLVWMLSPGAIEARRILIELLTTPEPEGSE